MRTHVIGKWLINIYCTSSRRQHSIPSCLVCVVISVVCFAFASAFTICFFFQHRFYFSFFFTSRTGLPNNLQHNHLPRLGNSAQNTTHQIISTNEITSFLFFDFYFYFIFIFLCKTKTEQLELCVCGGDYTTLYNVTRHSPPTSQLDIWHG